MIYSFRPTTDADQAFLFQLHVQAMREYIEATWGWDETWQRDYYQKRPFPKWQRIIVVNGQDAGVLELKDGTDEFYISLIELLPAFQSQGIGTAVLRDIIANYHTPERPVSLHVLKTNGPAHRLYERLGFRVIAEEELRYKMHYFS